MQLYKRLLRPLLFSLPPEQAHGAVEFVLRRQALWKSLAARFEVSHPGLATELGGIKLSNPVGVAAGFDKNCRCVPSLLHLGFGYVVGGTVMLNPRRGNPRPRLARDPKQRSLVNAMGFPSRGAASIGQALQHRPSSKKPLILSVAGLTLDEFVLCHRQMEPLADGIELNISSPNTAGLRVFQEPQTFSELLGRVNQRRAKPLFVKIPPYFDAEERDKVLELVRLAKREGVDGITAVNTRPIADARMKVGRGGLSGKPLFEEMLRIIAEVRREVGHAVTINACGGVFDVGDTVKALQQGANTVQLFTGLTYEGPAIAKRINSGLAHLLDEKRVSSLAELLRRR